MYILREIHPELLMDAHKRAYIQTMDEWLERPLLIEERELIEKSKKLMETYLNTPMATKPRTGKV